MVSVGGLDLVHAVILAELRISVLEKIVEQLVNDQTLPGQRLNIDVESVRKDALIRLQMKYPELDIRMDQE